jgi:hypothetical protein
MALDRDAFHLGGAMLAQMLFDLLAVTDLGEVDGGRVFAIIAFH